MIHREMVGLDLGSHSAKVVRAMRIAGRLILRDFDWVHLPRDTSERRRLLAAFMRDKGYADVPCVIGVPGRDMMLNAIKLADGTGASVTDIVAAEQERVEGLTEKDTAVDHVVFRSAGHRYLLLAMARADAVGRAASLLSDLGDEDVGDIVPGSMALYRAVYELGRKGIAGSTMCVDIGHAGAEVVVGRGTKVLFSRCLTSDGQGETTAAARTALPHEIAACMESCHAAFSTPAFSVNRIVLCGGGSLAAGTVQAVEDATGVACVCLSEWAGRALVKDVERYGRAIGLAACGLRRGGAGISLLPRVLRESRILRWQKQYWLLTAFSLVGLVLVLVCGAFMRLKWDREYLRLRQVELAGLHALDRKLGVTERLNEELERKIVPFRIAVNNADVLRMAMLSISRAKHPDDWISMFADADAYFASSTGDGARAPQAGGGLQDGVGIVSVIVEGYTPVADFSTVGQMIERLKEQPGVVDADLLGDERLREDPERDARWADTGCSLFVVEMTLEVL